MHLVISMCITSLNLTPSYTANTVELTAFLAFVVYFNRHISLPAARMDATLNAW